MNRYMFGLAPKGKADYAFLLHDLYHIKPDGIMTIVLPHGVLFRGGEEGTIRKNLIENNHIDAIIGLPANIFFGTGIPTIIMVLRQKRENTDVLIIDASKGFVKEGKNNKLRASDIKRITDTVVQRVSVEKYAKVVSREEIRENDYNLNIPRYVDSSEEAESWDIYASMFGGIPMAELEDMKPFWNAFPTLKTALFEDTDTPYAKLAAADIKKEIKEHADVLRFEQEFEAAFAEFPTYLKKTLIEEINELEISKTEEGLSKVVFDCLENIDLIDPYEAYQLLDDCWGEIETDLEMIQTEGFEATKKVDPNLVLKKKDGKDQEVQDGWVGHIFPFALIQETLLAEESAALKTAEAQLSEIPAKQEEIFESLTEEEKELCGDALSEEGDTFVPKEIAKSLKALKKDTSEEAAVYEKLLQVDEFIKAEKALKSQIKSDSAKLQEKTKETIESLTDEQAIALLEKKWIEPLMESLLKLPTMAVDVLIAKIQSLQKKYETTYFDLEREIKETEKQLASMIDELEGDEFDMKGLSEFKSLLLGE